MFEVLTCLEHEKIPVKRKRKTGERAITEAQARQLESSKVLPPNAFYWRKNSIQWRQFCGVVQLNGLTIEILPKIYGKESDPNSCRMALIKMLRKAGTMKLYQGHSSNVATQQHTLLDIFIFEFCRQVQHQNTLGRPRDYQQQKENLNVIKGKLLVSQQIRHNLARNERLFCQFDEFTEDILLNQIIKYTLRLLLPQCRSNKVKQNVSSLLMQQSNVLPPFSTVLICRI